MCKICTILILNVSIYCAWVTGSPMTFVTKSTLRKSATRSCSMQNFGSHVCILYKTSKEQTFYTCADAGNIQRSACAITNNNAFRELLGPPRFCSASSMFVEPHRDVFAPIINKRFVSMLHRLRDSPNRYLSALSARWDFLMFARWIRLHAVA